MFSTLLWTILASKGRLIKSVTPISRAWDILSEVVSAEIIITGTVSIQRRLFMTSSTSRPSISGMTMSSIIRDISAALFCNSFTAIRPFSTSMVSYSSPSISTKMERFISESSTISIFCLRFLPSILVQAPFAQKILCIIILHIKANSKPQDSVGAGVLYAF